MVRLRTILLAVALTATTACVTATRSRPGAPAAPSKAAGRTPPIHTGEVECPWDEPDCTDLP